MPTLNREQLNKILELMLKNQASDPGSMLVVDSDKNEILEGQELSKTTEGLTGKRNDVDFGGRKARKEAENREFITKGFGKDVLDQDGKPILDEKGFPKKSHGYYKQRGNVFRINALDGTTIGSEITVNPHEKLLRANVFYEMLMKRQSKDLESKIAQDHPKEITATKSQLIANMVEDTRKAAAKKMGLNEAEMKGMQMVFDMDTKNIIVMNPYNAADARCFDVSSTLDTIDMSVTRMFESAKEEELGALSKSIEVVEEENDAITKLDSDINSAMNDYEEQLKAYKKQSASSFESIKKAMLRDNVAPKTVDERMKALKGNMEKLDKIANLERYVAQTKAIQMKESLEAQEKATEVTRAALDKIENKDTALLYSAIKEGSTVFSQFAVNINQGFNDLLVNLKDQEVIDKAKADLAKAQKEYKSYLNRIGELEDKRLAKVKELKEKQSKQMDNLVKDAEEKQDAAYKERIKELKGSYSFLPSWLGGKTGLEKEIISTMADQAKAMASATLESVEEDDRLAPAEIAVQEHATEIMQERIRLRGLRDSINEQLESASQATTPSEEGDNLSVGFGSEVSEEGDRNSAIDSGLYATPGNSAAASEASDRLHSASAGDPKAELIEKLKLAYQVYHQEVVAMGQAAAKNKEAAKINADSAKAVTEKLEQTWEVLEILDAKVDFLKVLEAHRERATTKFVGRNKIKEYIDENQKFGDKREAIMSMFEREHALKPPEKGTKAGIARAVSQAVGFPLPDGLNERQITEMIKAYSKQRDDAETLVKGATEAIKRTKQEQVNVTDKSSDVDGEITSMQDRIDDYNDKLKTLGVSDEDRENLKNATIKIDEGVKQAILKKEGEFSEDTVKSSYDDLLRNDSTSDHSSSQSSDISSISIASSSSEDLGRVSAEFGSELGDAAVEELPQLDTIMARLEENAEQSLTARKKLTLLAELELMSPVLDGSFEEDGSLKIRREYSEKLVELEGLYKPKPDLLEDGRIQANSPEDLVRRYKECYLAFVGQLRENEYLTIALTGKLGTMTLSIPEFAKAASAITEAQVAKASISRVTAQQQTDAAIAQLLEQASEVGINLHALTANNGDNKLFKKLKDATITEFRCDEDGNCIPVKDEEGNEVKDASGNTQYETEVVRIFPEGIEGLVKKGDLDFLSNSKVLLDKSFWSNVSTEARNAVIGLLNGLIKMVNYVLRQQFGEWTKYTLPYQEITAAQLADVFKYKTRSKGVEDLVKKGVNIDVFGMLANRAESISRMQTALAKTDDKAFVTEFGHAVRENYDAYVTYTPGDVKEAEEKLKKGVLKGEGEEVKFKGLKKNISIYAENRRLASEYESLRKRLENTRSTKETKESIKAGDLDRLNNTEQLVRAVLRTVPLDSGTLDNELRVDADADASTIIAAARELVSSNTTDGKIGRTDVDPGRVMRQLDGIQVVADNTAVLDHTKADEEINTAKKGIVKTLTEMIIITNESTEADCLKEIKDALPEIKESLDKKLGALPEAVRTALAGKSIDARVEEKFGAMWRFNPLKYVTTKDQMRDKVIQEVLATVNDGKEEGVPVYNDIKAVKEVVQLQSMQEDLIGIQQEIMHNNDLMRASTKASVKNKDLHEEVKALYKQARETFPGVDFDPSSLEAEYKGKKMTVHVPDEKDVPEESKKHHISMPTRMIPVFVKALQEANLDEAYKAAQQDVQEAKSAVTSQEKTITGLEEKRAEAQTALDAAQKDSDEFTGEKVMEIQEDLDAPLLQNDEQNPPATPEWQAVMDRLKAAQQAHAAVAAELSQAQTNLTERETALESEEAKLTGFDNVKIEAYQSALTAMSSGLDKRTQDAVKGFKQHKERKDTITTRVKKAEGLMEKLQRLPKLSTPSVSRSNSSDGPEQYLDDKNTKAPGGNSV